MRRDAFTILELLVVIVIIALLSTLLFPVTQTLVEKGNNLKCLQNLRQIGTAAHLYANDHDNRFPQIEIDPEHPVYTPEDDAKPIHEAFKSYAITEQSLKCPADLRGPNWFAKLKSSYMWLPYAEDEPTTNITMYTRRGSFPVKPSRVRLATDYEAVHPPAYAGGPMRMNAVYADGHVTPAEGVAKRR